LRDDLGSGRLKESREPWLVGLFLFLLHGFGVRIVLPVLFEVPVPSRADINRYPALAF
jgi:hypothetical protein